MESINAEKVRTKSAHNSRSTLTKSTERLVVEKAHTTTAADDRRRARVNRILRGLQDRDRSSSGPSWLPEGDIGGDAIQRCISINNAEHAVSNLISHVTFDRDGGILNIDTMSSVYQHSKVATLQKKRNQIMLASFRALSLLLNSVGIIFLTIRVVFLYINGLDGTEADLAISKQVPLVEMIVGVKLTEAVVVSWTILRVLWHCLVILCPSAFEYEEERFLIRSASREFYESRRPSVNSANSVYSVMQTNVKVFALPKYKRIATIFWELLPRLQGFSALQIVQFAYPGLVMKTLDFFQWRHCAARLIAERFLKLGEHTVTDEELSDNLMRHILLLQYGQDLGAHEDSCRDFALRHDSTKMEDLVWMLLMAARSNNMESSMMDRVDSTALNSCCRFRLVCLVEDICKFGFIMISFAAGYITLFTKLCIFASLIMMEEPCVWIVFGYGIMFLNQVLNVLDAEMWLMWRVAAFLFGGADAKLSAEEAYIMRTYMAILCERIWDSPLSCVQKLAIMMTLDDDDIQRLVVEEDPGKKHATILGLREYEKSIETNGACTSGGMFMNCLLGSSGTEKEAEQSQRYQQLRELQRSSGEANRQD